MQIHYESLQFHWLSQSGSMIALANMINVMMIVR